MLSWRSTRRNVCTMSERSTDLYGYTETGGSFPAKHQTVCFKATFSLTKSPKSLDKPPSLCYNHPIQSVTNRKKYADATIPREAAVAVNSQSGRLNTFGQLRTEPAMSGSRLCRARPLSRGSTIGTPQGHFRERVIKRGGNTLAMCEIVLCPAFAAQGVFLFPAML